MTETRTIWVMGSDEDLPDPDTAGSGEHTAPSWATVSSTVRAIRLFKRGISKRLRRPPSELATPAAPSAASAASAASVRQSVRSREHAPLDLQLRPAEPSAADVADIQPSPAADGPAPATALFRAFSFRRTNSWHRSLRRDRSSTGSLRRPHDHQPPADAQWSPAGAGGLDAGGMLEAAGTAVLRPHVSMSAFLADSASYSVPSDAKQVIKSASYTASIADQQLKDKKDVQLKEDLRTAYWPLDHPARARLWQSICEYHGAAIGNNDEYESTVRQLEGDYGAAREGQHQMPPFVHTFYTNHYHLEAAGVWSADRVLAVLYYNNPTITYSPPLFPVCCLLLHYMDEADTYNALSMMLRNKKQSYLVQTRRDFEISWKITIKLCRKHTKSSMHYLHQLARRGENVEHVLADWMAWIFCFLPFPHAVRLMDCYLMEGEKVLYRAAMALVLIFHKMASRQMGDWGTMLQDQSIQDVMETFCTTIPVTPDKLLKTLFNIRGFSRDSLTASYARVKAQIKAGGGRLSFPERRCVKGVTKQHSQMGMPSVLSQDELAHSSSTIGVKELLRLWENLPQRFALYTPLLLYTSDEHGFSLKTFYHKVATFEPTVLLLRTTDGVVFGAYCSTSWGARNTVEEDGSRHTYFGTGETFLFTLRPQLQVFPWVGKVKQAKNPHLSSLSHSEQLFMAADHSMLTIGGGGGQAIWLDEDLSTGKTDACATFANPPLTATGMFDVACMEAFGFAPD